MRPASIAAVLSFYRNGEHILEAVASVLAQTVPVDEVIVVNDASPAGTTAPLERLPAGVRLIAHSRNLGVGGARQTGVEATRCSHVAFLDGDDLWVPSKIERTLAFWRAHPAADIVHTGAVVFRSGHPEREFLHRPSPLGLADQLRWNRMLMPTAIIPRAWIERVGGFVASHTVVPDWDMGIRLLAAGARIECAPEALTRVRRDGQGNISANGRRQAYRRVNTLRAHYRLLVTTVGTRRAAGIFAAIVAEETAKMRWYAGRPASLLARGVARSLGVE